MCVCSVAQWYPTLCDPMDCPRDFPDKNTGVSCDWQITFTYSVGCLFILLVSFAYAETLYFDVVSLVTSAFVSFAFGVKSKISSPRLTPRISFTIYVFFYEYEFYKYDSYARL